MLKRLLRPVFEAAYEGLMLIVNFFKESSRYIANLFEIVLPYLMLLVGQLVYQKRGAIHVGGEIFIPVIFGIVIFMWKRIANKVGKGNKPPIPKERFTQDIGDGEVVVDNSRLQEMILYVADVEDYLERKGML